MGFPKGGHASGTAAARRPSLPGHDMITDALITSLAQQVSLLLDKSDVMMELPPEPSDLPLGTAPQASLHARSAAGIPEGADVAMSVRIAHLRRCLKESFGTMTEAFAAFDKKDEGFLTYHAFQQGLLSFSIPWQTVTGCKDLRAIFASLNATDSGRIPLSEFIGAGNVAWEVCDNCSGEEREGFTTSRGAANQQPQDSNGSCRQPGRTGQVRWDRPTAVTDAPSPDRKPKSPRKQKANFDPQGMWKRAQDRADEREAWLEAQREERLKKELAEITPPAIHARSRRLGGKDDRPKPGTAEYNEHYKRKPNPSIQHLAKEMSACTFKPTLNEKSRNIFRQTRDTGEAWHERLQPEAKDGLHAGQQERDMECVFKPKINSRSRVLGQRPERGSIFDQLHRERRFVPWSRAVGQDSEGGSAEEQCTSDADGRLLNLIGPQAVDAAPADRSLNARSRSPSQEPDALRASWRPAELLHAGQRLVEEDSDGHLPSKSDLVVSEMGE